MGRRHEQTVKDLAAPSFLKDELCGCVLRDREQVHEARDVGDGQQ